jgi:hypothetical protein
MYLGLRMKDEQQSFTNNSRRIATPVLGFLLGKCRAAPITLHVIKAASFLPVYLCVSPTEALLMASSTSYLNAYRGASAFSYCIHALLVICKRIAVLVLDLGCKGSTLIYSRLVDPICYG